MYTYTAVHLEQKTFRELKLIARNMALVPLGDRRYRQNWVDVIVGTPLPLLKLLKVSPVVEVEPVVKLIEVQVQELIESSPGVEVKRQEPIVLEANERSIESKFGRIIYPKVIVKSIAPVVENFPGVAEGDRSLVVTEDAAQTSLGVEPVQATKPLIKRLEPAECDKLTFIELLELCRDTDKHLADKSLEQLQNLSSKVIDCTGRPGGLSSGNKRHRAFWIREVRRELTYLLRTRSLMQTPRGLGRHGGELWQKPIIEDFEALVLRFSPEPEHLAVIEVQAIGLIEIQAIEPIAPATETSLSVSEGDRPLVLTKDAAETSPGVSEGDRLLVVTEDAAQTSPGVSEGDRSLPLVEYAAQNSPGVAEGDRLLVVTEDAAETSPSVSEGDRLLVVTEDAAETSPSVSEGDRPLVLIENAALISVGVEIQAEPIELGKKSLTQLKSIAKNLKLPFGGIRKKSIIKNLILWAYRTNYSAYVAAGDARDAVVRIQAEIEAGDRLAAGAPSPSDSDVQFSSSFVQAVKISPAVEADKPQNRGDNGRNKLEVEPKLSQSAIVPAFKNLLDAEADQNPILTNITFSPGFLARYSPPQSENIHYQFDADGQLSLLDFEVESVDEPPDPDDFETLNAFCEAIVLWDAEHPEPLEVSLNSMSEWAPCPDDWYEPDILLELSEVLELSPAIESSNTCKFLLPGKFLIPVFDAWCDSSITCKFLIPVFDAWCDRANRQNDTDEPPDTGIFARLPKPKPPSFPPMSVIMGDWANRIKKFGRSATLLSGRSPL